MGVEHDCLPCARSVGIVSLHRRPPHRVVAGNPYPRREMFSRPSTQRGNSAVTPADSGIVGFVRSGLGMPRRRLSGLGLGCLLEVVE